MLLPTRARIAGILAISLLMLSAPGALAGAAYSHDASIRVGNGAYVGAGFVNLDATNQSVSNGGVVGDKLTFWIKIRNTGTYPDSYKVKRSAGYNNGYRVRYYNDAGTDVTGKVTVGSFTTPSMLAGQEYVMRATVKVRSLATEGSFTSRLITVSSVNSSSANDSVRFTGELAWLSIDFTGDDGSYGYYNVTGGGLMPAGEVTYFFTQLLGGDTGNFTLVGVPSTGDVSVGLYSAECNSFQSLTIMSLAANGSAVQDTETFIC